MRFPTRGEAIEVLVKLEFMTLRGLITDGSSIYQDLNEVRTCLEFEKKGFFIWGAPVSDVSIISQDPPYSPQKKARIEALKNKYRIPERI